MDYIDEGWSTSRQFSQRNSLIMVAAGAEIENDVVFVVEGTANLLLDFENLMKSYIEPAIQWVW